MYGACREHVEQVIEHFLFAHERAPELLLLSEAVPQEGLPGACYFCPLPPVYLVK
ncbi:MAG TPA: CxxH/CxxC protein [Firmicutes bacterium]|jgi:CxxH/CxxC protein (TIGR04129 family)|nr:CxxH/CxxC protein [Bacillota bacterium]